METTETPPAPEKKYNPSAKRTEYWLNGQLHRPGKDGPALEFDDGTKIYYWHGKRSRLDGPAVVLSDGTEHYYYYGQRHRKDGPATTFADGTKMWFKDGRLHRKDGPAVTRPDGRVEYWRHGKQLDGPPATMPELAKADQPIQAQPAKAQPAIEPPPAKPEAAKPAAAPTKPVNPAALKMFSKAKPVRRI